MTAEVPAELAAMWPRAPDMRFDLQVTRSDVRKSTLVNWHDLTDAFATRRAVHATVSDRRDDLSECRAEVGLAVVQTFFADDVHGKPQPPRGRIVMLPSGST